MGGHLSKKWEGVAVQFNETKNFIGIVYQSHDFYNHNWIVLYFSLLFNISFSFLYSRFLQFTQEVYCLLLLNTFPLQLVYKTSYNPTIRPVAHTSYIHPDNPIPLVEFNGKYSDIFCAVVVLVLGQYNSTY